MQVTPEEPKLFSKPKLRKETNMIKLYSLLAAIALAVTAYSAQVGDTIQKVVTVEDRVPLQTSLQPQLLTSVALESGVWSVTGQIVILSLNQKAGAMIEAAGISLDAVNFGEDGTFGFISERFLGDAGTVSRTLTIAPRQFEVEDGQVVNLVAGSFNFPPANVTAWGYIFAQKIRNHVP